MIKRESVEKNLLMYYCLYHPDSIEAIPPVQEHILKHGIVHAQMRGIQVEMLNAHSVAGSWKEIIKGAHYAEDIFLPPSQSLDSVYRGGDQCLRQKEYDERCG